MIPITATIASVAALISIAAAGSTCMMRLRLGPRTAPPEVGELEQAIEDLVRRLEAAAGRCIHDLESREQELRRLLGGALPAGGEPRIALDAPTAPGAVGFLAATAVADQLDDQSAGGAPPIPPMSCFETDLVSRAARARALAERNTDEATICRVTGLQRAELRTLLSSTAAQQKAP